MVFLPYKMILDKIIIWEEERKNVILYEMQRGTAAKCQVLLILRNTCLKKYRRPSGRTCP